MTRGFFCGDMNHGDENGNGLQLRPQLIQIYYKSILKKVLLSGDYIQIWITSVSWLANEGVHHTVKENMIFKILHVPNGAKQSDPNESRFSCSACVKSPDVNKELQAVTDFTPMFQHTRTPWSKGTRVLRVYKYKFFNPSIICHANR